MVCFWKVQYKLEALSLYYTFRKALPEFYWMMKVKIEPWTAEQLMENEYWH